MILSEQEYLEYMAVLVEEEKAGARQEVMFGPYTAMVVIGSLQLAARNPAMDEQMRRVMGSIVDQFRPWFAGTPGEHIIDMGNNPRFDQ